MIIQIEGTDYAKVNKILKENGIDCIIHDNVYKAVCYEEMDNTLDNKDKANINDLTNVLYNSKNAEHAFQRLTEEADYILSNK